MDNIEFQFPVKGQMLSEYYNQLGLSLSFDEYEHYFFEKIGEDRAIDNYEFEVISSKMHLVGFIFNLEYHPISSVIISKPINSIELKLFGYSWYVNTNAFIYGDFSKVKQKAKKPYLSKSK